MANSSKIHLEPHNSTIDHSDLHEVRKQEGVFLTDLGGKYATGVRRNPSSKPNGSRRGNRIPSERIISQKVTFIQNVEPTTVEQNRSFNLVK